MIILIAYRGLGGVKKLNYGNGRRLSLTYSDQRQFLRTMKVDKQDGTNTIINKQYTYFNDGRIEKIDDFVDTAWTTTYTYDAYNRLTGATGQPNAYSTTWLRNYTYDLWGNLRTVSNQGQGSYAGEAPNYTINYANNASGAPATNRIQSVTIGGSTTNYTYDAAGNLTAEGSTTYTYDAAGRMKEVGTGGQHVYGFDGDGKRVKKIENGAAAVYCVYSSVTGQSMLEVNTSSWTPYRAYVVSAGRVIAQQSHDGQFYWLHQDHLGTGHKLTNTTGVVVYRGEFDPHGQVLLETGSLTLNNKKFTGYERDATGLDFAQARMYNHNRGRFMQADPGWLSAASLSKPSSLNRYTYVENDPVNKVDRNGLNLEYWECTWTYRFGSNDGEEWILIGATVRCQSYNVPGGSGGIDPEPRGTGLSEDKKAQQDIDNAIAESENRLANDDCAKLFGGKDAAIAALKRAKIEYGDLGHPKYNVETDKTSVTGARTYSDETPPRIVINSWGPFRNTTISFNTAVGIKTRTLDFGTGLRGKEFASLLLLHELGHIQKAVSGFKPDSDDDELNRKQTQQVIDACFPKK